jgi:hypothetical protein
VSTWQQLSTITQLQTTTQPPAEAGQEHTLVLIHDGNASERLLAALAVVLLFRRHDGCPPPKTAEQPKTLLSLLPGAALQRLLLRKSLTEEKDFSI